MLQAVMLLLAFVLSGLSRLVRGSPDWFKTGGRVTDLAVHFKARKLVAAQLVLIAMVGLAFVEALSFGVSLLALGFLVLAIGYFHIDIATASNAWSTRTGSAVAMFKVWGSRIHEVDVFLVGFVGVRLDAVKLVMSQRGFSTPGGANRSNSLVMCSTRA